MIKKPNKRKAIINRRTGRSLLPRRAEARRKYAQESQENAERYVVKRLHFKKKSFSDGSGHWFEKSFKFPVFGRINAVVDIEDGIMTLEVKSNMTELSNLSESYAMVDYKIKSIRDIIRILRAHRLIARVLK
jgi:hypothetical protein